MSSIAPRGRGAAFDPPNRFETVYRGADHPDAMEDWPEEEENTVPTQVFMERARQIITRNQSPDIGFETSINAYRGCEHGCIYCYARQTHEYLGYSSGIDFETKIVVKENAPELLRAELRARSWKPQHISMSGVTDPYQPLERRFELSRRLLEVMADYRNPVGIVTKNAMVTRDTDILQRLAAHNAARVCISVTTLDHKLARRMEPRASSPSRRLAAVKALSEAGIPVGVLVCPVIPGLTDAEIPSILEAAAEAGAQFAGYNVLKLPYANRELFENWLLEHYPEKHGKVLNTVKAMRGGKLYDADFGQRMTGTGVFADHVRTLFRISRRKAGIPDRGPALSAAAFRRPIEGQLELFD